MIVWPDEKRMKKEAREALGRFRDTSAAAELESSAATWTVVAWPWTSEPPMRLVLENEAHEAVSVTLTEAGLWLFGTDPRSGLHVRSVESLDRDARGLPGDRPAQPATQT